MGIIFDIEELTRGAKIVREFEADGEKSEDNTEEYSIEDDGTESSDSGNTGEESGEDEGADGGSEGEDSGEPSPQNAGEDDEYTIDEPDDNGADDGEESGDEDPATDDEYTLNDEEEGEEGGGEEENNDSATDDEEYSLDGDSGESENGADDGESDEVDSSSEDTESKLKELEGEIFDTLSPEQKQIKIDELKRCYQELYERCDNIIELLNDSKAPDENTSKVFEYINNNLVDLKQYIYDYFSYTFDTKTYLENNAQYQKHLVVLNSLDDILKELREGKNKNNEQNQS